MFLPSALNVKVKRFVQARVNGGSNYDSLTGKLPSTIRPYRAACHLQLEGHTASPRREASIASPARVGHILSRS